MKERLSMAVAILAAGMIGVAHADMFQPSHSCSKPYKPLEFSDQWELDMFIDEVEAYKDCINDFVDEQNEAVTTHQQAAEEAVDEWNRFVQYELR